MKRAKSLFGALAKDEPVLIPAGMRGDRAFLIFSMPEEISRAVERRCE